MNSFRDRQKAKVNDYSADAPPLLIFPSTLGNNLQKEEVLQGGEQSRKQTETQTEYEQEDQLVVLVPS